MFTKTGVENVHMKRNACLLFCYFILLFFFLKAFPVYSLIVRHTLEIFALLIILINLGHFPVKIQSLVDKQILIRLSLSLSLYLLPCLLFQRFALTVCEEGGTSLAPCTNETAL